MTTYQLGDAGYTVYASMRTLTGEKVEQTRAYAAKHGADIRTVALDVQDDSSVDAAVAQVIAEQGRIDVLIHSAGHMAFGPAEAFMPEPSRRSTISMLSAHSGLTARRFRTCATVAASRW